LHRSLFSRRQPFGAGHRDFPANVKNNTTNTLGVTVVRVQTDLRKPSATNDTKVAVQPGISAAVALMGGKC
jgi:hypothetical protein